MQLMPGSYANILDAVGNTPMVKLNVMGTHTQAEIYVKCEYLNPGGSMKDRIGINIVNDAEESGAIKPGGTIVEATSGNTGMGLALVAAVRGYKCIFVMPDKMSDEKIRALRSVGAKVVVCPTNVEPEDPRSYYSVSRRIADETPNAFYANQYHNQSNPNAHYISTGPEIWEQTKGEFDVFCAGMGTGGTLSGTGRYFKERKPEIKIVGADPIGSIYYDYYKTGQLTQANPYKVEGIGEDFIPGTININILDEVIRVTDKECFFAARDLIRKEGILCGGSGGGSVIGAIKYAEMIDKPMRIVAHLPDGANRYITKFLDDAWMKENGFLEPEVNLGSVQDLLDSFGNRSVLVAHESDSIQTIIRKMKNSGVSQMPVVNDEKLSGVVDEKDLLTYLVKGEAKLDSQVGPLAANNFATISAGTPTNTITELFNQGNIIIVLDGDNIMGVITKIDLIEYMAAKIG